MEREFLLCSEQIAPAQILSILQSGWVRALDEIRRDPLPSQYQKYTAIEELRKNEIMQVEGEPCFALINPEDRKRPARIVFSARTAETDGKVAAGREYVHILVCLESHTPIGICESILAAGNVAFSIAPL